MGLSRVICVTPFHKRPEVSKIFLNNCLDIGLDVIAVCDLKDRENIEICNNLATHTIVAHQNITGKKWNQGIRYASNLEWDYLLILGSDDLISLKYFEDFAFEQMQNKVQYIGLLDALAVDLKSNKFRYWSGYENHRRGEPIGCGRLIHRDILKHYRYVLFPEVLRGSIDLRSHELIKRRRPSEKFIKSDLKPYRIGLKGGDDITKELEGSPFIHDVDLTDYYSDRIIEMIKQCKQ